MIGSEDDNDDGDKEIWEYIPVETADELMSCGDVIECNRLKNWNKWLRIRKQQQKHLGLMVSRKTLTCDVSISKQNFNRVKED